MKSRSGTLSRIWGADAGAGGCLPFRAATGRTRAFQRIRTVRRGAWLGETPSPTRQRRMLLRNLIAIRERAAGSFQAGCRSFAVLCEPGFLNNAQLCP